MEKLHQELRYIDKVLIELEREKQMVLELPFYKIFNAKLEQKEDLEVIKNKRKTFLNKKYTVLENIQLFCEKQKAIVSNQQIIKIA